MSIQEQGSLEVMGDQWDIMVQLILSGLQEIDEVNIGGELS